MTTALLPNTAPAPILPRRRQLLFGSAFASVAWAMFLLTLVGMYLQARQGDAAWLGENVLRLTQPNVQFGTLILSLFTVQWAVYSIARNDRGHAYLALAITLLFGVAFINQTTFLYDEAGIKLASAEGPLFYAVTGGHLAMLIVALIFLALMSVRALGGNFSERYPDGLSAAALFWYVNVGLYAVIWLAVYIMK